MPLLPTQSQRLMALGTPLGEDVLVIDSFRGTEQLSRPFRFDLRVSSTDKQIKFDKILGERVVLRLERADGSRTPEFFNGFVSRFSQIDAEGELARYEMSIVPWLWFLTRTSDCRIFQEMTVPDIIRKVCNDFGFSDLDTSGLTGTYRTWEYCVQYRETAFNFLSRLMEQEGIYYYFKHEEKKHTLMLADAPSAHGPVEGLESMIYRPEQRGAGMRERVDSWTIEHHVQPGAYVLKDFDFKVPKKLLLSKAAEPKQHAAAEFEMYDWPGEYVESSDGDKYAKIRLQELQAEHAIVRAETDSRPVRPGYTFDLKEHPREDQNKKHLIVAVVREATVAEYRSGASPGSGQDSYSCSMVVMDAKQQFRPARSTPKPLISGCQTATVVGKSGEEIDVDEHGRVKVLFHWDRDAKGDQTSSCWIRVSQTVAGKRWGAIHTPRVGQEVIVEFIEGDPDHPIITGRVYNGINRPPYELPGMKTISGIKSNSSKSGQGFNEIRFEDKKGDEQVFIHAEKNIDIRVKNDRFESVLHNRHLTVDNDQYDHIKHDRHETVDNDHVEEVGNDRSLTVKGKQATKVAKTLSLAVAGDVAEEFESNHSEKVKSDYYLKAKNICLEADTNITIKVGGTAIAIDQTSILIKADSEIEITSAASIKTKTAQLEMKSDASAKIESSGMAELKSPKTDVVGSGMLALKGGLVMIN
ncbi:MAG: type VI secretion system tip protein VgrG [Phycisphaeraceae bacterium]|nr:MAG: type VI secretion system tip protein VgrG [Phycisphaeraceae bacterium]